MIVITGDILLKPEHREQAIRLGCEHSARSRSEPGCISHNCCLDAEDPNRMHFFEQWQDMAAVQAHFAVPASGEFVRAVAVLAARPPEMSILDATRLEVPGL